MQVTKKNLALTQINDAEVQCEKSFGNNTGLTDIVTKLKNNCCVIHKSSYLKRVLNQGEEKTTGSSYIDH